MFLTGLASSPLASFAAATAGRRRAFAARPARTRRRDALPRRALIITSTFQGRPARKALAAWGAVGGAGAALGVLVGGVLTELVDWRLIFLVNLPVAAALALAARRIVPADTESRAGSSLDLRGAALATSELAAIVYALTQAAEAGWISADARLRGAASSAWSCSPS